MRADDLLEWMAGACFVAAAYRFVGLTLALLVAGVCLAYFAQCYDALLRPKARQAEKQLVAAAAAGRVLFHCNKCGQAEPVNKLRPASVR